MVPFIEALTNSGSSLTSYSSGEEALLGLVFFSTMMIPMVLYFAFMCLMFVVSIGSTIFWIYTLVDLLQRADADFPDKGNTNNKGIWVLVVVFLGVIGSAIYYFVVMKPMKALKPAGKHS